MYTKILGYHVDCEVMPDQQFLLSFLGTTTLPGMSEQTRWVNSEGLEFYWVPKKYYGRSVNASQVKAGSCAHIACVFAVTLDSHER